MNIAPFSLSLSCWPADGRSPHFRRPTVLAFVLEVFFIVHQLEASLFKLYLRIFWLIFSERICVGTVTGIAWTALYKTFCSTVNRTFAITIKFGFKRFFTINAFPLLQSKCGFHFSWMYSLLYLVIASARICACNVLLDKRVFAPLFFNLK